MENKVLEKNLARISLYDKNLAKKIELSPFSTDVINITTTKKDEYNLIYKNYLIHDDEGALEEAKKIVSKIEDKNNKDSIRIVYGLGLGYLADEVSNQIKSPIIVYEPNLDLLKFVLSIAQIDALYKNNVFICQDKNKLKEYIFNFSNSKTKMTITFLGSYKSLYFDDIKSTLEIIEQAQGLKNANKNTLLSKAPDAVLQTFLNLEHIKKNPLLIQLKDVYKDKTALVLSSGASLDENIETIKNNQDKFVIFAINSNIKLLMQKGITPDFVVNIETNDILPQYDGIDTKKLYFINEAFCFKGVMGLESKKTFTYISNINFLNPWLKSALDLKDDLETFGTVSYSAFLSAATMGFSKIILCGQDLAYKNGVCYTKGSHFDNLECVFDEKDQKYVIKAKNLDEFIKTYELNYPKEEAEKHARAHIDFLNKNLYTLKSQDGTLIPTQTGYALFIRYFCDIAHKLKIKKPNLELYNASCGGAQIDGFENKSLDEIVSSLEKFEKLDLSNYKPDFSLEKLDSKINKIIQGFFDIEKIFNEMERINQKLVREYEIKKTITPNIEKMIKKQKEFLRKIGSFREVDFISKMNFIILSDIIEDDSFDAYKLFQKYLNNSKNQIRHYRKILTNC